MDIGNEATACVESVTVMAAVLAAVIYQRRWKMKSIE